MSTTISKILAPVGSLFGGKKKAPEVKPVAVMPTPDDEAIQDARRRRITEMQARTGRASTIFTDEKIGG